MNILDKQELKHFLHYVDPEQVGYLNFQEFSKKVKNNMGNTDDLGN